MEPADAALCEIASCWELVVSHQRYCLNRVRVYISTGCITAEQAAEVLGVSRRTLFRMLADLEGPPECEAPEL